MDNEKFANSLIIDDTVYETQLTKKFRQRKTYAKPDPRLVKAYIPGIIREIFIKPGNSVKEGDKILILEAMKMKNTVTAHRDGKIKMIRVESGDMVYKGQLLVEFE